ncbi:MAG: aldose 1-epimerase family protein [Lachnospiraceae bacterium]|jgi:galactose mutarotase-like enzyme|nr:aldose 1-epimerase family protein [Lachnospiraceae bacterium]
MNHVIENENLKVTVADHGAEVRSIIRKSDNAEMMWQADAAYWGRTSPVLFPLVGNYYEKKSIYQGKTYELGQHGFARDMDFALVKEAADELIFSLKDTEETLQKYPFHFELQIRYVLQDTTVQVQWTVKNTNDETMYFSIGAHPAFNCDLDTYRLRFEKGGVPCDSLTANIIANDGSGCLSDEVEELELQNGLLTMSDELFARDALIIEKQQADVVTLVNPSGDAVVSVTCPTPLFGIWSPVGKHAPFMCIEPWYGRCDRVGYDQKLEGREYGNVLAPADEFHGGYEMRF